MKKKLIRITALALSLATILAGCGGEVAYPDPDKSVTIMVERGPGGGTDLTARAIAPVLEEHLGIPVVVVNKPGGDGVVGLNELVNSATDGYTLGCSTDAGQAIHEVMYPDAEYKMDSWDYLANLSISAYIFVLGKECPFETLDEVIAYAQEHPGELTLGTPSGVSEVMAALEMTTNTEFTQIVGESGSQNLASLAGGHVDVGVLTLAFYEQCIDQGLNVLGVMAGERFETVAPELPTFKEMGYDVETTQHWILMAPKGIPEEDRATLMAAVDAMGADEDFTANMENIGNIPSFSSGDEMQQNLMDFVANLKNQIADWKELRGK